MVKKSKTRRTTLDSSGICKIQQAADNSLIGSHWGEREAPNLILRVTSFVFLSKKTQLAPYEDLGYYLFNDQVKLISRSRGSFPYHLFAFIFYRLSFRSIFLTGFKFNFYLDIRCSFLFSNFFHDVSFCSHSKSSFSFL